MYMNTLFICSQNQHMLGDFNSRKYWILLWRGVQYNVCPIIFNILVIYLNKIKRWMYRVCYIWMFKINIHKIIINFQCNIHKFWKFEIGYMFIPSLRKSKTYFSDFGQQIVDVLFNNRFTTLLVEIRHNNITLTASVYSKPN